MMPASPQIVARSLCRWLHDAGYRGPYGRAHACTRALASWRNSTPPDPHTGPGILTGLFTFFREALYRRGILLLEHLGCKDVATPWCHAFVECCPSLRYKVRQIRGSLDRAEGMGDVNDFGLYACIINYHHFYARASMAIRSCQSGRVQDFM